MTATRWYLHANALGEVMLTVERVSDRRGYTMFVASRAEARRKLPYLRGMAESIDAVVVAPKAFDPVEGAKLWTDETNTAEWRAAVEKLIVADRRDIAEWITFPNPTKPDDDAR